MTVKYDELLGIPYKVGLHNCWNLIRRFYKLNWDIPLPMFADPSTWWDDGPGPGLDIVRVNAKYAGLSMHVFHPDQVRVGDILGFALWSGHTNHLAVYVGEGKILHQLYGRHSEASILRGEFLNYLTLALRHPLVPVQSEAPPKNMADIMSPSSRRRMERILARNTPTQR